MRLPQADTNYRKKVRAGRYTLRKLLQAQKGDLASELKAITTQVKTAGRHWEDKEDDVIDSLADRDFIDDTLDATTQDARVELAGRGRKASSESPYIDIFHSGVGHYTEATLDNVLARYTELTEQFKAVLSEDDPVRAEKLPIIETAIEDYKRAEEALTQAEIEVAMARMALKKAEVSWARVMEKVYGLLIAELGIRAAERFFN